MCFSLMDEADVLRSETTLCLVAVKNRSCPNIIKVSVAVKNRSSLNIIKVSVAVKNRSSPNIIKVSVAVKLDLVQILLK